MLDTEEPASGPWHLDRTVPIGLIITILLQTITVVWVMSGLFSRVDQQTRDLAAQDQRIRGVEQAVQAQAVAGATFATQISGITDTLAQIRQDQRSQIEMLRQILGERN